MFKIRKARNDEYETVRRFYHSLIRAMRKSEYQPGWEVDIYPSREFLLDSIQKGNLYIGEINDQIAAAMVINHEYNESYNNFEWPTSAEEEEITVIHALGVHPDYAGHGLAAQMVQQVIAIARDNRQKVIRLDVLRGNLPAEKLYEKAGFRKLHILPMYYEDTGWTDYELYELVL